MFVFHLVHNIDVCMLFRYCMVGFLRYLNSTNVRLGINRMANYIHYNTGYVIRILIINIP